MAISKKESRLRRAQRGRAKIRELGVHRLSVHRTPRHIYVQVFAPQDSRVVASASTVSRISTLSFGLIALRLTAATLRQRRQWVS